MNENYSHRAMPKAKGTKESILKGLYLIEKGKAKKHNVQLLGSGYFKRSRGCCKVMLAKDFNVCADVEDFSQRALS